MTSPRSPRLLEAALDSMPFTVLVVGTEGQIERGNAAWDRSATAQLVSLPNGGIGSRYVDVLASVVETSDDDAMRLQQGLADVLSQRNTGFEHECLVTIDGARRWFRVVMTSTPGEPGAVVQHFETTASHHEQQARADALAHFQAVFETAIDSIIIFNDDLQFLSGNPAVEQLLGRTIDRLYMKRMTDVMPPESAAALRRQQRELLVEGTKRGLMQARRADGSMLDLEYVARANFLPGRHMAQLRDMTSARQLETQLRQAQKMQAVGQLTGGIAHDFNNLLTIIVAHADVLLEAESRLPDEAQTAVSEILRASQRGADMVRKLMAFGRQEQLRLEAVPVDVLAADLTLILRRLLPETIHVRCTCDDGVPPAFVDATAVQQILFNLATNARDAMQSGGGELHIHVGLASGPANDLDHTAGVWRPEQHLCMTVTDTGAGMSEETLARIFEPFYTTKKVGEGTGLGMAMVYGLTEQMHGRVTVRSQPGEGTSVSIHVPLATAAATLMPTTPRGDATPSTRRETLLLVEDDDAIRLLASRVLQRAGYRITEAVDGESAAHCMREQMERGGVPFAIVVSDIVMPRGGGARVLEAVRAYMPTTRLLWVTGYPGFGTGDDRAHAPSNDPLLQKPWTAAELLMRVRDAIDHPVARGLTLT